MNVIGTTYVAIIIAHMNVEIVDIQMLIVTIIVSFMFQLQDARD